MSESMKDLSGRDSINTKRVAIIAALIALVIGLIVILFLFGGGSSFDVNTPKYQDGKLLTTVTNSGQDKKVWIQYNIFRQEGFGSEQVGDTYSYVIDAKKGNTLSTCDVTLKPGPYKVFIYISSYSNNPERIAGFIRDIEVT